MIFFISGISINNKLKDIRRYSIMEIKFICEDSYEAEKLSSIFTLQKDNSLFVIGIVKVIENEAVVKLKDGSHHSILFKDRNSALMLKRMFTEMSLTKNKIISTHHRDNEIIMNLG
jgi:hypothetical protein